ncbi:MAG: hypothetical protein ABR915_05510 [Thermoguttaceae bacterium]|jgi:hypothetical protein
MIVNKHGVLTLFTASLGLVLAGVLAATASWAAWRIHRGRDEPDFSRAERSMHLATLVAVVCLAILVIGWPMLRTRGSACRPSRSCSETAGSGISTARVGWRPKCRGPR